MGALFRGAVHHDETSAPPAGVVNRLGLLRIMACSEPVYGHRQVEAVETYRGTTVKMELVEKVRIDIGVSESFVERTISALAGAARTGEVGDGKIFVTPVERVVRIRTGERDQAAVTPALAGAER